MTVIVGVIQGGRVYVGADSAVTAGDNAAALARPKVRRRNGILFGACGDMSVVGAILDRMTIPDYDGQDVESWMAKEFWSAIRGLMKEMGLRRCEFEVLVAVGGRLACVDNHGAVIVHDRQYAAVGSGGTYALGALYNSRGSGRMRVKRAIEAAIEHCSTVRGPLAVLSTVTP